MQRHQTSGKGQGLLGKKMTALKARVQWRRESKLAIAGFPSSLNRIIWRIVIHSGQMSSMGFVVRVALSSAPMSQRAPPAVRLAASRSLARAPAAVQLLSDGRRRPLLPPPRAGQEDRGLVVADAKPGNDQPSVAATTAAAVRCGEACSALSGSGGHVAVPLWNRPRAITNPLFTRFLLCPTALQPL